MIRLREVDAVTARLAAAADVPELLAAAWEALDLVRAVAGERADPGSGLYATFLFASAAAAEAQHAVGLAPSMPAWDTPAADLAPGGAVAGSAGSLTELARRLARRLADAAQQAELADDRAAFEVAAASAEHVCQLLTGDR